MVFRPPREAAYYEPMATKATQQRNDLNLQRRKVDFDTYDITVDELIRRSERGRIEVAPSYQR